MNVYDNIIGVLNSYSIDYKTYEHGPILSYEDAEKEKQNHNWNGIESKNVFMTNKKGKYFGTDPHLIELEKESKYLIYKNFYLSSILKY